MIDILVPSQPHVRLLMGPTPESYLKVMLYLFYYDKYEVSFVKKSYRTHLPHKTGKLEIFR